MKPRQPLSRTGRRLGIIRQIRPISLTNSGLSVHALGGENALTRMPPGEKKKKYFQQKVHPKFHLCLKEKSNFDLMRNALRQAIVTDHELLYD